MHSALVRGRAFADFCPPLTRLSCLPFLPLAGGGVPSLGGEPVPVSPGQGV